jgi:hypothetical protein
MENNFGLILLDSVRKNKEKYLGLLRRNGVLVNTNISCEDLTNMILKAMQKSSTFKTETITLMTVLMNGNNSDFTNFTGDFKPMDLSSGIGYQSTYFPTQNSTTASATTDKVKKDFADTTVGTIFDKLFTIGNKYLENKELDVRKTEAQAGQMIAQQSAQYGVSEPPKSNVALYVGLGIGGIAIIGLIGYLISKNK